MNSGTLIDTDILIDESRGIPDAVNRMRSLQRTSLLVSIITRMELIVGCESKAELRKLEKHLSRFTVIPINEWISQKATDLLRVYRLSHGLLMADSLIAATALMHKTPLLTKNQSDYRFIKGLRLLSYP